MACGLGVGYGPPEGMTSWPHGPPRWKVRLDESQAGTPLRNGRDAEAMGCGGGASVDPVCTTNGSGRKGWEAWELCGLPHLTHIPPCEMPHKACEGSQGRSLEEGGHRVLPVQDPLKHSPLPFLEERSSVLLQQNHLFFLGSSSSIGPRHIYLYPC